MSVIYYTSLDRHCIMDGRLHAAVYMVCYPERAVRVQGVFWGVHLYKRGHPTCTAVRIEWYGLYVCTDGVLE